MRVWALLVLTFWIKPAIAQGDEPCRMKASQLRPLIAVDNPYFTAHRWNDSTKTETAELGPTRRVEISQEACLRYHVQLLLVIGQPDANLMEPGVEVKELMNLTNRVFRDQMEYQNYRGEFERLLTLNAAERGTHFNFHIADRSFIVSFENGNGAKIISLEMVKFLYRENIEQPGIPAYLDDGWFRNP